MVLIIAIVRVNGARLNDKAALSAMGLESSKFVDILVQCSLRQMLDNGFFHAGFFHIGLLSPHHIRLPTLTVFFLISLQTPMQVGLLV